MESITRPSVFNPPTPLQRVGQTVLFILAVCAAIIFMTLPSYAIDVSGTVSTLVTDGTAAITAIGIGLITLAGIAIVFKWAKAAFFG